MVALKDMHAQSVTTGPRRLAITWPDTTPYNIDAQSVWIARDGVVEMYRLDNRVVCQPLLQVQEILGPLRVAMGKVLVPVVRPSCKLIEIGETVGQAPCAT